MKTKLSQLVALANRHTAIPAATAATLFATSAHAELPTAVGTTITAISADATAMFALVFPVVGTIVGLVVVIKLFKKFTGKI